MLLSDDPDNLQIVEAHLNNNVGVLGMRSRHRKCKIVLQDWISSKLILVFSIKNLRGVDKFCYLHSYISPGSLMSDEVSLCTQKAPLSFINQRHLWLRNDS